MKQIDSNEGIVQRHYNTDNKLNERIDIFRQYSSTDVVQWVLDQVDWCGNEKILDAGCGSGNFLIPLQDRLRDANITGFDLSKGILQTLFPKVVNCPNVQLGWGDVEELPFIDDYFDVVMANFMLQHISDIKNALTEFQRVLRPNGLLICTTSSIKSKHEMYQIHYRFLKEVFPNYEREERAMSRFSIEEGWRLVKDVFGQVDIKKYTDRMVFPNPDPVMRYYSNSVMDSGAKGIDPQSRDKLYTMVETHISEQIQKDGEFVLLTSNGVILAKKG